jgi:hypothetical protein
MTNTTDITNLTDAALDVVLEVKSGADCVTVDHLTYDERVSVCKALGVEARTHWLMAAPYAAPRLDRPARGMLVHTDVEGMILDRQDREVDGEI